jgi:HK97 family phage major capsid protein
MTIREFTEKRNKLLADVRAIMTAATVSTEQRVSCDTMLADANILKGDIERLEACGTETEVRANMPPRDNPSASVDGQKETRSKDERLAATNVALRSYLRKQPFETRDLTVIADGIMVPTGVAAPSIALKSAGYVYDIVKHLNSSTGEPVKVPFVDDVANSFVLESAAITTTDPTVSGVTISIDDLRRNPILLDNSLVQDTGFDLVQFVLDAIQLSYQRTVANFITNGNASNVQGLLANVPSALTTAVSAKVGYNDLVNLVAAIDPAYLVGAAFMFSTATQALIAQIVDSNLRPLFLPFLDGGLSGFAGSILGYPCKINPYMPAIAAGNTPVSFGNHSAGYTFREVGNGPRVLKLSERYAELNRLGVVAFARVGGAVTDAGTHPVQALTVHA